MGVGDEIAELVIERLAGGGRGVARREGLVWLVQGAVPGDRVLAEAITRRPRLVEARVKAWIEPSPARRTPPCPIQAQCGGCPWMVLDEGVQRGWKRALVVDALERIGGLRGIAVDEPLASPRSLGYRNKVELTFGRNREGRRVLGYHAAPPGRDLVDVERCLLPHEAANAVLALVRAHFLEGPGASVRLPSGPRQPLRLVLRLSAETERILAAFRGPGGPFPELTTFAHAALAEEGRLASVVRIVAEEGRRGGARTRIVAGEPWVEETLAGLRFRLPPDSFVQVNPGAAELLCERLVELAGPLAGTEVVELYAGVGVFSLALARGGARAEACEADRGAVESGRRAARENGGLDVRFVCGDVARYLRAKEPAPGGRLLIADPPRSGFGPGVAREIARLSPERVLLVSCDPATLARDARALVGVGYALRRVIPLDLFPQTPHVETLTLLER